MEYIIPFVSEIPLFWLEVLPMPAFILVIILSAFTKRKRGAFLAVLVAYFLSVSLVAMHTMSELKTSLAYAFLLAGAFTLFSPLLRLHVISDKKDKKERAEQKHERLKNEAFDLLGSPAPVLPQVERVERVEPEKESAENDLQLEHVLKILKKLQRMKLAGGDRLETDVIYNSVMLMQGRHLTAEETSKLNDHLAALLKLMSKYAV